jgi:hypothetical protein
VQSGKGLTACPAESEAPEAEINFIQEQQSLQDSQSFKTYSFIFLKFTM